MKTNYDKLGDFSIAFMEEGFDIARNQLKELHAFDFEALDQDAKLNYRLFEYKLNQQLEGYEYRFHNYPVNQMFGSHTFLVTFMTNNHRIDNVDDAKAYIARLNQFKEKSGELIENLNKRHELGVVPPKFVFPHVYKSIDAILVGDPFTKEGENVFYSDFRKKIEKLDLAHEDSAALMGDLTKALLTSVKPGYHNVKSTIHEIEKSATDQDGVWKLPDGGNYYNYALKTMTTTDMTADDIHEFGLAEVARIHSETRDIMKELKFEGTLQEFFTFMREDPQFYYPSTDEGRQEYLDRLNGMLDAIKPQLEDYFGLMPKADLEIKRVEEFREHSAPGAFYNSPAIDGSRPGIYYVNMNNMERNPIFEMAAIFYHEALPGHHMQIAIAQELQNVPKFRKFGGHTAYSEGWGLYAERLAHEMDLYKDPVLEFGRLSTELMRAMRLVVDTGIHAKQWTRQQTIDYILENSAMSPTDAISETERYIVSPGQATAYKVGMQAILDYRAAAKKELGDDFDIKGFHDTVLGNGAVPLAILEEQINAWVAEEKKK